MKGKGEKSREAIGRIEGEKQERRKHRDRRLVPAYFLKLGVVVYFVVFSDFQFYKGGVVLNDERGFGPEHVFKIDPGKRG